MVREAQGTLIAACVAAVAATGAGCEADLAALAEPTQAVVGRDGRLYVSDGYRNARVAVFGADGAFEASWGSRGFGPRQFNTPHAIAVMSDGALVVADRDNGRLQHLSAGGAVLDLWYGPALGRPWAVAVGPGDALFVVDGGDQDAERPSGGLARLDSGGAVTCRWSGAGDGPDELDWGHMIAVGADEAVYVVDLNHRRVLKFAAPPGEVCGYVLVPGWPVAPLDEDFRPLGIAAGEGRVYVSEDHPGAPIRVLDEALGDEVDALAGGRFERAHGLSLAGGTLWVADQDANAVLAVAVATGEVTQRVGALAATSPRPQRAGSRRDCVHRADDALGATPTEDRP